jgi:diguanylate cyclase (GGDEF)-like protein
MEQQTDDPTRHAHLVALLILIGVDVASLIATPDAPTAVRIAHLLMPVVGGVGLMVLLAGRRSAAFGAVLPVLGATLLARLGALVWASGLEAPPVGLASAADASFVLLYVLAFVSLPRRRAVPASAAVAATAFGIVAAGVVAVSGGAFADDVLVPLQTLALHAAVIGVLSTVWSARSESERSRTAPAGARIVVEGIDELTGLTSYSQLNSVLERELARSERHLLPLSVILIGLDDLQTINEQHGERVGDSVLLEVSTVLAGVLRSVDTVGRWGGDEFLVIAPTTGPDDALALAMRCRYKLRHHPMPEAGPVTASFGVSTFEIGDDSSSLVERATDALADAKAAGRDRVEVTSLENRIADEARRRSDSGA